MRNQSVGSKFGFALCRSHHSSNGVGRDAPSDPGTTRRARRGTRARPPRGTTRSEASGASRRARRARSPSRRSGARRGSRAPSAARARRRPRRARTGGSARRPSRARGRFAAARRAPRRCPRPFARGWTTPIAEADVASPCRVQPTATEPAVVLVEPRVVRELERRRPLAHVVRRRSATAGRERAPRRRRAARRRPGSPPSVNGRTFMARASRARRRARSASAARRPAAARAASPSRLIQTVGRPSSVAGATSWKRLAPTCTCASRRRRARRTPPSGGGAGLYEPISDATIASVERHADQRERRVEVVAVGVREDRELPAARARVLERGGAPRGTAATTGSDRASASSSAAGERHALALGEPRERRS